MDTISNISRRDIIQNLAFTSFGLGLMQFTSCRSSSDESNSTDKRIAPLQPFYLPPQEPLQPGPGGVDMRIWVRSSQTNLQFSCIETALAPKKMGPEPHYHKELDEVMLVLEGTATVMVDGKVEEIQQGGFHMRPRNIEHTFWNGSDKPLRFLDMYFNQNFEDFLEELFHNIIPEMIKNKLTPADPSVAQKIDALYKKFGVVSFPEKRQAIIDKYGLIG